MITDEMVETARDAFSDYADYPEYKPMRAALEAVAPMLVAQQWQPIETAPKQVAILVYHCGYEIAHFNTVYNRWIGIGEETVDTRALAQFPPTHWMPLPPPPRAQELDPK